MNTPTGLSRILVGFTGGVRSTIAAMMLKTQGFEVLGVFLDFNGAPWNSHCSKDRKEDALQQAAAFDISLIVIPAASIFQAAVADRYLHDVLNRRVPQTCLNCNLSILFPVLSKIADERGIAMIATGHRGLLNAGQLESTEAKDDQAPWLAFLPRQLLNRLMLPLGSITPPQIAKLAREIGLTAQVPTDGNAESRQPCALSQQEWLAWASARVPTGFQNPGPITHAKTIAIAEHGGILDYPIGSQVTIESAGTFLARDFDTSSHTLHVALPGEGGESEVTVEGLNWIEPASGKPGPSAKVEVHALGASAGSTTVGTLFFHLENEGRLLLQKPMTNLFRGTPLIFFAGKRILGAGWVS